MGQNWPTYCLKVYLNNSKTGQTAQYLCDIPQWGLQLCFGPFWSTLGRKLPFLPVEGIILAPVETQLEYTFEAKLYYGHQSGTTFFGPFLTRIYDLGQKKAPSPCNSV